MRVGMAVPAFLPATSYGGPIWNIIRLVHALRPLGVEVTILTSTLSGAGRSDLPQGPAEVDGMSIERMPVRINFKWSPVVAWRAPARPIDALHVFGLWNGLSYSAIRWAHRAGVPCVWEPSGMLPARGKKIWIKRWLTLYNLHLARCTAGIVWTAPQEREEAPRGFAELPCWLRPNPAPEPSEIRLPDRRASRAALGLPAEGPIWGYLGRIAGRKGIEDALRVWSAARGPGHLVLAGPVEDPRIAAELRRAGPGVVLHEPLAAEDRWKFLRAIDGLILIPSFGENFALVVVEAIAAGTPAFVSPAVGAGHWLAGHGAVVLDPPESALLELFRAGSVPRLDCSIPTVLSAQAIGSTQRGIYESAIARRGSR